MSFHLTTLKCSSLELQNTFCKGCFVRRFWNSLRWYFVTSTSRNRLCEQTTLLFNMRNRIHDTHKEPQHLSNFPKETPNLSFICGYELNITQISLLALVPMLRQSRITTVVVREERTGTWMTTVYLVWTLRCAIRTYTFQNSIYSKDINWLKTL